MQITVSVDQSEIGNVQVALEEKLKEIEAKAQQALYEGGLLIETACKEECPVDTGELRSSISTDQVSDTEVEVAPHTDYAWFVEFGTYKMLENPYMQRGIEGSREDVAAYITSKLQE